MTKLLSEFYEGKTIFITGAAGFFGSYLLEVLLRCFPEIACIYILLRPKKGLHPTERRKLIFKKKIFLETCENNPKLLEKVKVVAGDISKPNFDMSEEDVRQICEEVTVVFHCAANIGFTHTYRYVSIQNAKGVDYLIDLCRKLKKLDILVYTSSAYANSHILPEKIEEKVHKLPQNVQKFLDEMEKGTDESFAELVSALESKWNMKWPNTYTFSKCLAENILYEKASDLPVAIVRPSIIFSAYKGILPGYLEEGLLMTDFTMATVKGLVKVIHCDANAIIDIIPIDIVANCHIISAWLVATHRCPSMFVVHCTSGDVMEVTFGTYVKECYSHFQKNPVPNSFLETGVKLVKNKFWYSTLSFYYHYIPVVVMDIYFRLKGSKYRLMKFYRIGAKMSNQIYQFVSTTHDFEAKNFHSLSWELQPEEREVFYTDLKGVDMKALLRNLPYGATFYDWSKDKLSPEKRRQKVFVNTIIITIIRNTPILLILLGLYLIM